MNVEEVKQEICQNISCKNYLNESKYGMYCCPFCGSGKGNNQTGALKLYDTNTFYCFSCKKKGDVIDLIKDYYHVDYKEALTLAIDKLNIDKDRYNANKRTSNNFKSDRVSLLKKKTNEKVDYTYFFLKANKDIEKTDYHRGLSLKTLNYFKVGFVSNWKHPKISEALESPRLIVPTSKYSYLARDTRKCIPEFERKYSKLKVGNLNFFNIDALYKATKPVFVVEGEFDAMSIFEVGGEAIALGTIAKVKSFLELLKTKKPSCSLIIALDNDESGEKAAQNLIDGLKKIGISFYRYNFCKKFKDANEILINDRYLLKSLVEEAENMPNEIKNEQSEAFYGNFASNRLIGFVHSISDEVDTPYISTGFKSLDDTLDGGLYEGLYVIGAVSSLGKTTLALQICDQIAQSGENVVIFSLEMSASELMAKSISRHTLQIDLASNRSSKNAKTTRGITTRSRYDTYNQVELGLICDSIMTYEKYANRICIYEGIGNMGVNQIREKVQEFISFTGKRPVVLVDYVQILAPLNIMATDKQNIDKSVIELKRISRDFKIPVIGISSFNRSSYRGAVTMESFKESGSLEYGSDVLIGLQFVGTGNENFDVNEAKIKNPREIEMVILKNRNGSVGKKLNFNYYPTFNYFEEIN